jgi:hypothetical protein
MSSFMHETESEFRTRLSQAFREQRDLEVEKLRRKYSSRFTTLKNRLMLAEQAIAREQEQAKSRKMDTVLSFGTAILGAFMGRKAVSVTSASRMSTAMKSAGRIRKEKMDVARAQEKAEAIRNELSDLELRLQGDIQSLVSSFDPSSEPLDEVFVRPKSTEMTVELFCLAWMPYRKDAQGRLSPDWA